jgi:SnoaL-like protein
MSARDDILHLLTRYAFTIDTGDLDGFADLFAHGEWRMENGSGVQVMLASKRQLAIRWIDRAFLRHILAEHYQDSTTHLGWRRRQHEWTRLSGELQLPLTGIHALHGR